MCTAPAERPSLQHILEHHVLEALFSLRYRVARVGETDWLAWWDSHALTDVGDYAVPRLFRRTPRLSAAHMAIGAARARHDALVPREPLVHLFDLGEVAEVDFERWLVERKAERWEPAPLVAPSAEVRGDLQAAFRSLDMPLASDSPAATGAAVSVTTVTSASLTNPSRRLKLARELVEAYGASGPGSLVVPFARIEG